MCTWDTFKTYVLTQILLVIWWVRKLIDVEKKNKTATEDYTAVFFGLIRSSSYSATKNLALCDGISGLVKTSFVILHEQSGFGHNYCEILHTHDKYKCFKVDGGKG